MGGALWSCATLSFGGLLSGVVFGAGTAVLISFTDDAVTEISLAVAGMYLGYYIPQVPLPTPSTLRSASHRCP